MAVAAMNDRRIIQVVQMRMHVIERSQRKAEVQEQAKQQDEAMHRPSVAIYLKFRHFAASRRPLPGSSIEAIVHSDRCSAGPIAMSLRQ